MWSLFSRTGSIPFEILDLISEDERSLWKIHKGKRKGSGEEVTVFVCEGVSSTVIELAKAAVKRLKMLKHPSVLKFVDSWENEKSVYLVTEVVIPLRKWISEMKNSVQNSAFSCLLGWGLLQITQGLSFINNDAKLIHSNINISAIYVTHGGEWKIFGLEYTSSDPAYSPVKVLPQLSVYDPPEVEKPSRQQSNLWSRDAWGLGCLIWEVFSGCPLDMSISLQHTSKIPKSLVSTYCELVGANPLGRPNAQDVLDKLRKKGHFFHNDLIEILIFLDEIQIKDDNEKHRFFSSLSSKLDNIPDFISKNKILPALLTALEFSNVGSVLLTPIFKIGHILEDSEYQSQIVPCVVKMFSSTDRATRLKLLQQMESLSDHLDPKTVNDQVFQPLVTGFQDTNPTIREHTVKAVLSLAPKINYHNLNVEIMKHFARLQSRDDQGGIRTNTTVCLGKIASCLHPDTRQKCLVSAFTRAMRDPFPPARIAGVTAIGATQQFYPLSDVASKILPAMSHLTLDPEKAVRDAVFRVIKGFIGKLEKVSEDPDLKDVMEKEVSTASSISSTSSSWAGWAVGALASKFYKGPVVVSQASKGSSESSTAPSTRASSLVDSVEESSNASTPARGRKKPDESKREQEENSTMSKLSSTLAGIDVSEEVGDGWGDDEEEWGSLEVDSQPVEEVAAVDKQPRSTASSTSSYGWGDPTSSDDFFSSFASKPVKTSSINVKREEKPANSKPITEWDTWGESQLKETTDVESSKTNDSKRARDEKRLQRQREIEAKRAARSGPMKLAAKKI